MVKNKKLLLLFDSDVFPYLESKLEKEGEMNLSLYFNAINDRINNVFELMENTYPEHSIDYLGFLSERSFRHKYKSYKAGRIGKKKPLFFYEMMNYLRDQWKFFSEYQLEADDLCLIYENYYKTKYDEIIIISNDKDLRQIPGIFYNPKYDKWFNISQQKANINFYRQLLWGDSGDGISGLKGCGEGAVNKQVTMFTTLNSILDDYFYGFKWTSDKGATRTVKGMGLIQGLEAFTETFNQIYMLRTLEDVKFVTEKEITIKEPQNYEKTSW